MRSFLFFLPLCVFVFCQLGIPKNAHTSTSEAKIDSFYKHDPYDISQARVTDSTDVYVTKTSKVKYLLRSPRYILVMMVYPLEKFALQVEYAKLWVRYYKFFTNKTDTFGLFPHGQLGGETGTGVGVRLFHTNILGRKNALTAHYIYSGEQGQFGEGLYVDPNLLDTRLIWKIQGGYLQTKNRNANINGAIDDDELRLFELKKVDVETSVEWRLKTDEIASFAPQFKIVGRLGFSQRNFMPVLGGLHPLSDPGSSPQARLVKGLGTKFKFYRFGLQVIYDDRDYKKPIRQLSYPPNYRFPGRMVTQLGDQFYFARDIGYPERGGFITLEGDWVTGPDRIAFYKIRAEAARYITLFWKNRILVLHARVDKVRSVRDGFVPYTELIQLGGNKSARGYTRGYFRGQGALQFNVEYRYPIWDYSNVFLFWDEGQIFDHFGDLRWGGFHSSWGGGIAFRTEVDLLGKIKIGHSTAERFLIGFTMSQAF